MNVKFVISEKVLRAILDSRSGEIVIGESEQFFPCGNSDERLDVIEFFFADVLDESNKMSVLMSKTESYKELLSAGYVSCGKKYVLSKKSLKFRREGKSSL